MSLNMATSLRAIHRIGDSEERIVGNNMWPGMLLRQLQVIGLSNAGPGYEMQRPAPDTGHLLVCYGGVGEVFVDGDWRHCGPGQTYLTPPLAPMGFRTLPRRRWQFAWAYLTGLEHSLIATLTPVLVTANPGPLVSAIEGLYLELARIEASGTTATERLELWGDLVRSYIVEIAAGGTPNPLWRLWAEVDARLSETWSLERLATFAGMHPETLRRLALRTIGRSPMQQVTHLRMRRAEALLRSTQNKIQHIAQQVGYSNMFAFSTAFRRWKGEPPNRCRPMAAL